MGFFDGGLLGPVSDVLFGKAPKAKFPSEFGFALSDLEQTTQTGQGNLQQLSQIVQALLKGDMSGVSQFARPGVESIRSGTSAAKRNIFEQGTLAGLSGGDILARQSRADIEGGSRIGQFLSSLGGDFINSFLQFLQAQGQLTAPAFGAGTQLGLGQLKSDIGQQRIPIDIFSAILSALPFSGEVNGNGSEG